MSFDEAVAASAKRTDWNLEKRPTLIFVYDPSKKNHVAAMGQVDKDPAFVSASQFLNLIRIDVRTIKTKMIAKNFGKKPVFLIYDMSGKLRARVEKPRTPNHLLAKLKPIIESDYGRRSSVLISRMVAVLARQKYIVTQLTDEVKLITDPKTGKRNEKIAAKCQSWQNELDQLAAYQKNLLTPRKSTGAVATGG